MEMEYINENTLRVFIDADDLAERGVSIIDLLQNRNEVEHFFMSILEEADVSNKFQQSDSVTFQVMPKKGGLDLYISKAQDDSDDGKQQIEQLLKAIAEDNNDQVNELQHAKNEEFPYTDDGMYLTTVFEFDTLEDLVNISQDTDLEDYHIIYKIYHYKDHFYLVASFEEMEFDVFNLKNVGYYILEFAHFAPFNETVLQEHGELILADNSLSPLRDLFSN
ncbi:MAG: adaptor protein MecA [Aerococcus sp.]|nr:adaptor protein MecA [Aerococcus sp.]